MYSPIAAHLEELPLLVMDGALATELERRGGISSTHYGPRNTSSSNRR